MEGQVVLEAMAGWQEQQLQAALAELREQRAALECCMSED
jgi:hypothetical protein